MTSTAVLGTPVLAPATAGSDRPAPRTVRGVRVRDLVVDGLVVLALGGVMAWEYTHARMDDGLRPAHIALVPSVVFSFLTFAPIAVRRLAPFTALLVGAGALALPSLVLTVDVFFWSGFAPVVFLVFSVARLRPLRTALLGAGTVLLLHLVYALGRERQEALDDSVFLATFLVFAVALGVALRSSDQQRRRLDDLLTRVRAEQADRERLVLADERAGLARDLHDVVAHAVSLMLVQAGAARLSLREEPALARRFLAGVEQAGRDATTDLSTLLTVLRAGDPGAAEAPASLGTLPALVARMRRAGLAVDLTTDGDLSGLPVEVDAAAYRVVQEALTNVTKHAGPTRVDVVVARTPTGLAVVVRDAGPSGPRPPAPVSGHGLVGLRERVALLGGTVEAGPSGGGFRVRADLPGDGLA